MTHGRGKLIVISAPSGCGKTTITNALLRRNPEFIFSVSATTRTKRRNEVHGKHYFFLTEDEFRKAIDNNELVEWEEIYGDCYGTLKRVIDEALESGKVILFDIDVNGGLSIKKHYPDDTVLIFIKPPSLEDLKKRLRGRKTEGVEQLERRLQRVPMELEKGKLFDYSIVNDDLDKAIHEVNKIVHNEIHSVTN